MKKKPQTFEQSLVGALAATRTARTRLYRILGHKKLGDEPQITIEIRDLWKRADADAKVLARILWKTRVYAHAQEHLRSKISPDAARKAHDAHLAAHAKTVA